MGEGTQPVDRLRALVKRDLRPKMLTAIVGSDDAAGSVKRLNEACAKLNNADQGQLAEEWLIAHRVQYAKDSAYNYLTQVFMTQKDNPAMSGNRKPDLGIRQNKKGQFEINEVKSGTAELSANHDIPQIEDMLKATEGGGVVPKGEATHKVQKVRLTLTNAEKVRNNARQLGDWVDRYRHLSVEFFDESGNSISINKSWLRKRGFHTFEEGLAHLGVL